MLSLLVLLLVTQVPCTPNDSTLACYCKQAKVSACVALRGTDPKLADEIERQLVQAARIAEAAREQAEAESSEATESEEQASTDAPEPPDCTGQKHHVISRPIARVLEEHKTLRGLYKPRDQRFVAQAKDKEAHCGYQEWHRKLDEEISQWLRDHGKATAAEFEKFLREVYSRKELRARFPNGF